jgi:hypothetical protein
MSDSLWETQFRDFLTSPCGREVIDGAFDRHEVLSSSSCRTPILSVHFNGLTIADSCPLLLFYLKKFAGKTLSRCHQVLTEVGLQMLKERGAAPRQMVKGINPSITGLVITNFYRFSAKNSVFFQYMIQFLQNSTGFRVKM